MANGGAVFRPGPRLYYGRRVPPGKTGPPAGTAWTATPADSVTMSDGLSFDRGLAVADNPTLADALAFDRAISPADSVTMADALSREFGLNPADSVTMSDGTTPALGRNVAVGDSVTPADALAFDRALNPADSVTMSDARAFDRGLSVADSVTMSDAVAFDRLMAIADTLALADLAAVERGLAQLVGDSVTMSDSATPATGKGASIDDTVTMSDAVSFDRAISPADSVTMADAQTFQRAVQLAISDTVTMSDQQAFDRALVVADAVALADQLATATGKAVSIADTVTMADAIATSRGVALTLADSVTMSDLVAALRGYSVNVADTVTPADAVRFDRGLTVADAVALADALVFGLPFRLPQGLRTSARAALLLTEATSILSATEVAGASSSTAAARSSSRTGADIGGQVMPKRVTVLGYSNQALGGVDPLVVEGLIGRPFHGLRQNADIPANWQNTGAHISQFDLGRTFGYRAMQLTAGTGDTWARVSAGDYDAQILTTAANIVNSGRWSALNRFLFCFQHETSLAAYVPLGTAQQFIDAFRHWTVLLDAHGYTYRDRFGTLLGGPLEMVYCVWDRMLAGANGIGPPTAGQGIDDYDPDRGSSPAPAGVSYYGPLGGDIYNVLDAPGVLRYGTDARTLLRPLRQAAIARGKDYIVPEFGCPDGALELDHVQKAAWLDSARVYIKQRAVNKPGVCRALCLTVKASSENFNVDSSPASLAAFQRYGAEGYFA